MFDKLIVLCGPDKSGKTKILGMLVQKYGKLIGSILYPLRPTCKTRDFVAIYEIKKKKVGFVYFGDNEDLIKKGKGILLSQKIKLDVIVCTCHPGKINFAIKTYSKNSAIVIPKEKDTVADNNLCINEILKNI